MVVAALSHWVDVFGGRYVAVGALAALEANIRQLEEVLVCRLEVSEVPLAEIPSHTPVQQGVRHLGP